MSDIEFVSHPAADYFPMMSEIDFDRLKDDIRLNGQVEPVLVFGNQIVDGRNRYKACKALGIEPRMASYGGDPEKITSYIISTSLHRGTLTDGQKAVIGAKIKPFYESHLKVKSNASDMAARAVNLPTKKVSSVIKIIEKGVPSVIAKLEAGKISVEDAIAIVGLEQDKQEKVLEIVSTFEKENESVIKEEVVSVCQKEEEKVAEKIGLIKDAEQVMLEELSNSVEAEIEEAASEDEKTRLADMKEERVAAAKRKTEEKVASMKEKVEETVKAKAHKVFAKIQDLQKKKTRQIKTAVKEIKADEVMLPEFIVYVEWIHRNGELNMAVKNSELVKEDEEFCYVKGVGGKKVPKFAVLEKVDSKDFAVELCAKAEGLGDQHKESNEEAYLTMEQQFLSEFKKMASDAIS